MGKLWLGVGPSRKARGMKINYEDLSVFEQLRLENAELQGRLKEHHAQLDLIFKNIAKLASKLNFIAWESPVPVNGGANDYFS
jgi:hypothetical protein